MGAARDDSRTAADDEGCRFRCGSSAGDMGRAYGPGWKGMRRMDEPCP